MKKAAALLICALGVMLGAAAHAEGINVTINGAVLVCEAPPVNVNDRVLVPVRSIFEALGANVSWDGANRTVWANKNGEIMTLTIDSAQMGIGVAKSDGTTAWTDTVTLDVPAMIINDWTFVPVRAVSEALKTKVGWDGASQTVAVTQPEIEGKIYYSSASDGGKLYSIDSNGGSRRKVIDKSVNTLRYYDDYVYYYVNGEGTVLHRVDQFTGMEQTLTYEDIYDLGADNAYIYFVEGTSTPMYAGSLYRMSFDGTNKQLLTDGKVKYAEMHGDYIYYNIEGDDRMYVLSKDGTFMNTMSLGDNITLYPFNCRFINGRVFVENHAWYSNIFRFDAQGYGGSPINTRGSFICKNQQPTDTLLYVGMDDQNIYGVGIDGGDDRLIVKTDDDCFHTEVLTQWGNIIYYKNMMRKEVYSANLDGSDGKYVCYADDVKAAVGHLFSTLDGLYVSGLAGENMTEIYKGNIAEYKIIGSNAYIKSADSGRLYKSGFGGGLSPLTSDSVGEWICGYDK